MVFIIKLMFPLILGKNQPKLIVEPTIGMHRTKAEAALVALNKTAEIDTSWNEFFGVLASNIILTRLGIYLQK